MNPAYSVHVGFRSGNEIKIPCASEAAAREMLMEIFNRLGVPKWTLAGTEVLNLDELEFARVIRTTGAQS